MGKTSKILLIKVHFQSLHTIICLLKKFRFCQVLQNLTDLWKLCLHMFSCLSNCDPFIKLMSALFYDITNESVLVFQKATWLTVVTVICQGDQVCNAQFSL